eukprot:TRINITY_DN7432_c0_g1_i1.p1 TRINITY_DN7432_c0_g1~~TRINITY_DN7432_c0_g1_i1.p1  ORF type:complete len:1286 (-),score=382.09 TRINITY_DN7432_c0_g1_i1:31-3888(-)
MATDYKITIYNQTSFPSPPRKYQISMASDDTWGDFQEKISELTGLEIGEFDIKKGLNVKKESVQENSDTKLSEAIGDEKPYYSIIGIKKSQGTMGSSQSRALITAGPSNYSGSSNRYGNTSGSRYGNSGNRYGNTGSRYGNSGYSMSHASGYVGLSNQGATCYLNSLIQTLYMTPEFRSAIYNWDFQEYSERLFQEKLSKRNNPDTETEPEVGTEGGDAIDDISLDISHEEDSHQSAENSNEPEAAGETEEITAEEGEEPVHKKRKLTEEELFARWQGKFGESSIPRQLQKLFLKLQLSESRAVKTTDLTKSFGWERAEAFTQHDVQELCRVLFDALEKTWVGTDKENLINDLYQGKMKDFVRCLECGYEGSREDSYLDIPLVIKPFGATKVMGSIEEALRKFVEVEHLKEDNQYHCSECDDKVDAHKGLTFLSFPYLLTLQLKRFDFDYMTMRRIKLNDRVTFPEVLDMNQFLEGGSQIKIAGEATSEEVESSESEEETIRRANSEESEESEEEIDEELQAQRSAENQRKIELYLSSGPYVYELFSILIHRGSALGGHYYAYVKSFEKDKWMCFNDSSVTTIPRKKIEETYGSKPRKVYSRYGGASAMSGSSGANAYMLMYRKVDPHVNISEPTKDSIPEHVREMIDRENAIQKEKDKAKAEKRQMIKLKVYYNGEYKYIDVHRSKTINDATRLAAEAWKLEEIPEDCIRLREYQTYYDTAGKTFKDPSKTLTSYSIHSSKSLLIEVRKEDEEFPVFDPSKVTLKVFVLNESDNTWSKPHAFTISKNAKLRELREYFEETFGIPIEHQIICKEDYNKYKAKILTGDNKGLKYDLRVYEGVKLWLEYREGGGDNIPIKYVVQGGYMYGNRNRNVNMSTDDEDIDFPLAFAHIQELKNTITVKFGEPDSKEFSYKVTISKSCTLLELKEKITEKIDLEIDQFKVMKGSINYKVELRNEEQTLQQYNLLDGARLYIEKGSPLRSGEVPMKIVAFDPNNEEGKYFKSLFEFVLRGDITIEEAKTDIFNHFQQLQEKEETAIEGYEMPTPEEMILREKFSSTPSTVLLDTKTVRMSARGNYSTPTLVVQRVPVDEPRKKSLSDKVVFLQQFIASEYALGTLQQIIVKDSESLSSLRKRITEITGVENVAVSSAKWNSIRLLSLPKSLWFEPEDTEDNESEESSEEEKPKQRQTGHYRYGSSAYSRYNISRKKDVRRLRLKDGDIIIFKDNEEPLKELSMEDRTKIAAREKKLRGASVQMKPGYRRREEGVKITTGTDIDIGDEYSDEEQ